MKFPFDLYESRYGLAACHDRLIDRVPVKGTFLLTRDPIPGAEAVYGELLETWKPGVVYRARYDKELAQELSGRGIPFRVDRAIDRVLFQDTTPLLAYESTEPLRLMTVDIEVATQGDATFPTADRIPICMIGIATGNVGSSEPASYKFKTAKSRVEEKALLRWFAQEVTNYDPDILNSYFGKKFDWPYIQRRMHLLGLGKLWPSLARDPDGGDWCDRELPGRVLYDSFLYGVIKDQTLFGLPDRTLKTIANHFKHVRKHLDGGYSTFDAINDMANHIDDPNAHRYMRNDVVSAHVIALSYLRQSVDTAEIVGCPLGNLVLAPPSFPSRVLHGKELHKRNVLFTTSNVSRHTVLSQHDVQGKAYRFEGAIVGIYAQGLFTDRVKKLDFRGMYPSIIQTLKLCPLNTRILRVEDRYPFGIAQLGPDGYRYIPHTRWKELYEYMFHPSADRLELHIPDAKLEKTYIIEIDYTRDSFLWKYVEEAIRARKKLKTAARILDPASDEYAASYSRQYALKVIPNTMFGFESNAHTKEGDLSVGIVIIGVARLLALRMLALFDEYEIPKIEVDTDGAIVHSCPPGIDKAVERAIADLVNDLGLPISSKMEIDTDDLVGVYSYKAKNYILLPKVEGRSPTRDDVVIHGVAFKGSHQFPAQRKFLRELAFRVLTQQGPLGYLKQFLAEMPSLPARDFVRSIKLSKPLEAYDPRSMMASLGRRTREQTGHLEAGDQIFYVVARGGSRLLASELKPNQLAAGVCDLSQASKGGYGTTIIEMAAKLGVELVTQLSLF